MKRFIEGVDRSQTTLFPERLEDWVGDDNPVRVVDVFVDELELFDLGFERVVPHWTGRPGYHPAVMLKLYIYGYLNRVQSSRRLEREAGRNVEVMWLTGRLAPDYKTIADFRKDNGGAIREVCARFVALCRELDLLAEACVAIDGSKFKAVNSRDRNATRGKMERRKKEIEKSVERYLQQLDSADRQEPSVAQTTKKGRLTDKLAMLKEKMTELEALEAEMLATPDQQISLTDPDARSMATKARGSGVVGYNVQAAVDTTHHLIVAHDVINEGHDRAQLSPMSKKAKAALGANKHLGQPGKGPVRQAGLPLCGEGRRLHLPRRRTPGPSLHQRGERADAAPLLDQRLQGLRDQGSLHRGQGAPHHALGTRACRRGGRAPARREPTDDAHAAKHRRASVRHHQVVDGIDPLPNEDTQEGRHRDGLARAGLQSQACHEHPRHRPADRRDEGRIGARLLQFAPVSGCIAPQSPKSRP
jgi:transposase